MIKTRITNLDIGFIVNDEAFFDKRLNDYKTLNQPVITIKTVVAGSLDYRGKQIDSYKNGQLNQFGDSKIIYRRYKGSDFSSIMYNKDWTNVEITLAECDYPLSITDREYMATNEVFNNIMSYNGSVVLHSSSISYLGKGLCFSAISGTGKSTHTGLWKKYFGADAQYINDDKPSIFLGGDKPQIYGNPWSGKTDINQNISAPLSAIIFIKQAKQNKAYKLDSGEAYYNLLNQTFRPFYDSELSLSALLAVEKILETTPIFMLECNISLDAVTQIKNLLQDGGIL